MKGFHAIKQHPWFNEQIPSWTKSQYIPDKEEIAKRNDENNEVEQEDSIQQENSMPIGSYKMYR